MTVDDHGGGLRDDFGKRQVAGRCLLQFNHAIDQFSLGLVQGGFGLFAIDGIFVKFRRFLQCPLYRWH
ncbi:hypothetical protein [Nostoc sp.]|uniref:hypothetical protein n=1 Tax=Nostoc sp. TaxID=1180 RepID=UPI002FFC7B28